MGDLGAESTQISLSFFHSAFPHLAKHVSLVESGGRLVIGERVIGFRRDRAWFLTFEDSHGPGCIEAMRRAVEASQR